MKNEMKITEGKWNWKQKRGNNYYEHVVYAENGNTIADLQVGSIDEIKANAKLIAAAPDLLNALIEALDQLETWNEDNEPTFTMRRVKEAINKATL